MPSVRTLENMYAASYTSPHAAWRAAEEGSANHPFLVSGALDSDKLEASSHTATHPDRVGGGA